MDVYPSRASLLGEVALMLFVVAGVVDWLVESHDSWAFGVVALIVVLLILRGSIRDLRHPKPVAHLDENGLESDFGFEPWSNVRSVDVRWCVHPGLANRGLALRIAHRLVLQLASPDPAPRSPEREYAYSDASSVYDDRIEVPLWGSKARVLADVRRASSSYGLPSYPTSR